MPSRTPKYDVTFPEADWTTASPADHGLDPAGVDEAMRIVGEIAGPQGNTQSMLIRNGYLLWQGPDLDTKHTIWSCSKSFMSLAMGLLVDDGKCRLDSVAGDFLPSLKEHYPDVTLLQFANFTSGYAGTRTLAADGPAEPPQPDPGIFIPGKPLYAPGTMFHYSGSSDQLANVLTRIAGEPLRDLFRRRVAEPIGLTPVTFSWGDWGEVDGLVVCGGSGSYEKGISITARMLARVGWLCVQGGRWKGRQLISREWIEASTSVQVERTIPPYDPASWYLRLPGSYGVNWWCNGVTPDGKRMWPAAPPRTAAIQGNMNNFCFVIPEWNMVLVRCGIDARIENDNYTRVFARLREAFTDGTM